MDGLIASFSPWCSVRRFRRRKRNHSPPMAKAPATTPPTVAPAMIPVEVHPFPESLLFSTSSTHVSGVNTAIVTCHSPSKGCAVTVRMISLMMDDRGSVSVGDCRFVVVDCIFVVVIIADIDDNVETAVLVVTIDLQRPASVHRVPVSQ